MLMVNIDKVNIHRILQRLLEVRGYKAGKNVQLQENEISGLCLKSREIFLSQPILLELEAPLKICGDIEGQYYDLLHLFEYGGFPSESNYFVSRRLCGQGQTVTRDDLTLAGHKICGFHDECKRRYNIKLWETFTGCYNCLLIAAIVDKKTVCCHGGFLTRS